MRRPIEAKGLLELLHERRIEPFASGVAAVRAGPMLWAADTDAVDDIDMPEASAIACSIGPPGANCTMTKLIDHDAEQRRHDEQQQAAKEITTHVNVSEKASTRLGAARSSYHQVSMKAGGDSALRRLGRPKRSQSARPMRVLVMPGTK